MNEQTARPVFDPFQTETGNIQKTLIEYANRFKTDIKNIDFSILSISTVAANRQAQSLTVFDTSSGEKVPQELFGDENITISQKLLVKIFPTEQKPYELSVVLSADKMLSKIMATIKKESRLVDYPNLVQDIYDEICKKMARHQILLGIFDFDLPRQIGMFIDKIKNGEELSEDYKFAAAESTHFRPSEDDKITYFFENKKKQESEKPDFYNRGFIVDVDEGEILIEYKKPVEGTSGRNVLGVYIKVDPPRIAYEPRFSPTGNITIEETESVIRFIAAKKGFVVLENNLLDVQDELQVQALDFKTTGSIVVEDDKDISLNITESNPVVDAIGSNMTAKASEIAVHGSVGDNATIHAERSVKIEGLTHASSKIYTKEAEIATHKGYLEATNAKIERLEGGEVIAQSVHIDHASSGRIIAKKVYITNLGSNCFITASSLVDISVVIGDNNKIVFEMGATPSEKTMFQSCVEKEAALRKTIDVKRVEFKKTLKILDDNKVNAMKLKELIDDDVKHGRQPNNAFVLKYNQFTKVLSSARVLRAEFDELKTSLDETVHELDLFESRLLDARVINHGVWKNFQTIVFKVNGGKKECKFIPQDGTKIKAIGLLKLGDGQYSVGSIDG